MKNRKKFMSVILIMILFSFTSAAAATPDGLDYMLGKWTASTSFYDDGTWSKAVATRAVADSHLGGSFIKVNMTVPFPGAAFSFELLLSYDKFNKMYRLAFLDDINGYLDIYTGQIKDGILTVDNEKTGTSFPDGKGGFVVGVLEFKESESGGFSLFARTGSDASGELQPYMQVEFKPIIE